MPPETVYIVEQRIEPLTGGSVCEMERETSYTSTAFTSKNQAYRTAIREQIGWLQKSQPLLVNAAAEVLGQKDLSLDCRLALVQDKFDEIDKSQQTIHRWKVKELGLSDVKGIGLSENSDHSGEDEDDVDESEEEKDEDDEDNDEGEGQGEAEGQGEGEGEDEDEDEAEDDEDSDELDELEDEEDDDDDGSDDDDDDDESHDEDVDDDARSAKRPRH